MKQLECNKCGRYFEFVTYSGEEQEEWGYCPFCENDNVETNAKRNGDFVDLLNAEIYDLLDDMAKRELKTLRKALELLKDKNNYYKFVNEKTETIDVDLALKMAKEMKSE